jgi:phytoene dehydrogenase-like protein
VAGADVVVTNADVASTYTDLLGDPDAPYAKRYRRLEPSSSALVFYWGIRGAFPELGVNNIFFSKDYPAEFNCIFKELRCPDDPTVYVNITSKTTPGDAPPGCENWFVLVNAPRNEGQDWAGEVQRMRKRVLEILEGRLGRRVGDLVEAEDVMTPQDIEEKTGSRKGSLYGISSNSKLSAFLRHPNRSRRYPGLYFCGGSAHPGGGMPLALLSGSIAAGLVKRYQG